MGKTEASRDGVHENHHNELLSIEAAEARLVDGANHDEPLIFRHFHGDLRKVKDSISADVPIFNQIMGWKSTMNRSI